jgi:Flp pilus assembly protein CpaB
MSNLATNKIGASRRWTLVAGIVAIVLAAVLLIAYLIQYRSSVQDETEATPVVVAKNLIPKGTSGTVIAEKELYQIASLPKEDLKAGAISDPSYLNGRAAVVDIFPGAQITTSDVTPSTSEAIPTKLTGLQRAVAIPVGGARGLVGIVADGDFVDIYYEAAGNGGQVLGLLASNVLVMRAPTGDGAPAILKLNAPAAQRMALAADTGTLWFLLRPAGDAKNPPPVAVSSQQLLALINAQTRR